MGRYSAGSPWDEFYEVSGARLGLPLVGRGTGRTGQEITTNK